MEVQVSTNYLIVLLITSGTITAVIGAVLGLFGQVWLEKLKHKHKKEERKEDKESKEDKNLTDAVAEIREQIKRLLQLCDNLTVGLKGLYYDKILYLSNRYIDEKSITAKELSDVDELHDIYTARLNGNGFLDKEMNKVHKLPRVKSKPGSKEKVELLLREIMGTPKKPSSEQNEVKKHEQKNT